MGSSWRIGWFVNIPSTVTSRSSRCTWSLIVDPSCKGWSDTRNLRECFSEIKRSNGTCFSFVNPEDTTSETVFETDSRKMPIPSSL